MFCALNGWRFVFSILIILHHMPIIKPYNANFGNPVVTFFFVLSGFLLTTRYRDKLLNGEFTSFKFISKRVIAIFPLQWLFTALFLMFSINVVTYNAVPFHLTLTQSLVPFWEINFTLNTPSWFLSSIFVCYLVTPLIIKITKRQTSYLVVYILAILAWHIFVYLLPDSIGRRWVCYINPWARLQDYGIGVLLAIYWKNIENALIIYKENIVQANLLEVSAVFLFALSFFPLFDNDLLGVGSILLDLIICIFITVFSIGRPGGISRLLSGPGLNRLGKLAFVIFMSHTFVLNYTKNLLEVSVLLYFFTSVAIVIVFSYIVEEYYCKHMRRFLLWLLGITKEGNIV